MKWWNDISPTSFRTHIKISDEILKVNKTLIFVKAKINKHVYSTHCYVLPYKIKDYCSSQTTAYTCNTSNELCMNYNVYLFSTDKMDDAVCCVKNICDGVLCNG